MPLTTSDFVVSNCYIFSFPYFFFFFFFNDTATTEIYTLSLHDALPISWPGAFTVSSMRYRPGDRADRSTASARLATATSPARVAGPSSQCSLMVAVWEASPSASTVRRSHPTPSGVTASDALTGPAGEVTP